MNVLHGIEGLKQLPPGGALSIGNFDGLHRGHRHILDTLKKLAKEISPTSRVAVVTFEPHPLTVLKPQRAPPRLTPPALKQELLEHAGIDDYVVLPPTHDVLDLSAEAFWSILRDHAKPAHLVEGDTFNFGKDRRGTIPRLRVWTAQSAIQLHVIDPVEVPLLDLQIVAVNSSLIRWLISYGRVRDAAICLGRPYLLEGTVIEGHRRGRTIGTPTANLQTSDQLIPADGVYVGRSTIDDKSYPAAVSIGTLPTFNDAQPRRQVEAHLIGFDGNLYGHPLRIELLDWVRDQIRFTGIDALKHQIQRDLQVVASGWKRDASRAIAVVRT